MSNDRRRPGRPADRSRDLRALDRPVRVRHRRRQRGDGSEVAAGRDPTNPADDLPVQGCLTNAKPTPAPAGPTPVPSAAPDSALEGLLPDDILGRPTTQFSIVGHPENDTYFGPIFRAGSVSDHDLGVPSQTIEYVAGLPDELSRSPAPRRSVTRRSPTSGAVSPSRLRPTEASAGRPGTSQKSPISAVDGEFPPKPDAGEMSGW